MVITFSSPDYLIYNKLTSFRKLPSSIYREHNNLGLSPSLPPILSENLMGPHQAPRALCHLPQRTLCQPRLLQDACQGCKSHPPQIILVLLIRKNYPLKCQNLKDSDFSRHFHSASWKTLKPLSVCSRWLTPDGVYVHIYTFYRSY